MRKIYGFYIGLIAFILLIVGLSTGAIHEDYSGICLSVIGLWYVILLKIDYFSNQPIGFALWVNPIIQLSIILIKLDEVEKTSETKRIVTYLNDEFDEFTAKVKFRYYKKEFKKEHNFYALCQKIKRNSGSIERVRVVQHLIRVSLSDRLLTDDEKTFIELVSDRIGLPRHTLKTLLAMHTYVTEQDIKNQRYFKSSSPSDFKLNKAYSILGLEPEASLAEVKEAYRELVKLYHPDKLIKTDKNKERAKQQFQAITDAYDIIKEKLA